jgi:quinol-cytochrome oxidoreductase complex cytochrome b subunit
MIKYDTSVCVWCSNNTNPKRTIFLERPGQLHTSQSNSKTSTHPTRMLLPIRIRNSRSIPNKLGGVIALAISIAILFIIPTNKYKFRGVQLYPINQVLFWTITNTFILLTWIEARPIEELCILTGQILPIIYFTHYIINPTTTNLWDKITK